MIEQAKLNQAFFARYGELSFLEGIASWAEPSLAELLFPKAQAKTKLSQAKLQLRPNTSL